MRGVRQGIRNAQMPACLFKATPLKDVAFFNDIERATFYRNELYSFLEKDKEITPEKIINERISWADLVEHDEFMDILRKTIRWKVKGDEERLNKKNKKNKKNFFNSPVCAVYNS